VIGVTAGSLTALYIPLFFFLRPTLGGGGTGFFLGWSSFFFWLPSLRPI